MNQNQPTTPIDRRNLIRGGAVLAGAAGATAITAVLATPASAAAATSMGDFLALMGAAFCGVRVGCGPFDGRRPVSLTSASVAAARLAMGAGSWVALRGVAEPMRLAADRSVPEAFLVK